MNARRISAPGGGFEAQCEGVDEYLATRTYLVGHELTLADLAMGGVFDESSVGDGGEEGKVRKRDAMVGDGERRRRRARAPSRTR